MVLLKEEPRAEFDSLLRGLQSDLKPEGTLEGLLVDNLAAISWRKRRLLIAEGAEIRKGTEFIEWEAKRQRDDEAANISFLDVQCSGLVSQITNPKVLEKCLDLLQRLHKEIEEGGFDEKEDKAILARLYGDSGGFGGVENSLFDVYSSCVSTANSHASAHEGGEVMFLSPAACKYKFFHFLNKEITRLQRYKKERAHIESNKMEIEWLRANVPDASQLDRLLRYETTLQRDFDRTLSQLERLQRMRLGQPVLPKLEVQHSLS
ncbi:MAG TPA: hypothetical protein VFN26_04530 [Candidatus Acidoferrum sp.]|nr:hypothetical protein [Candidatus Acidoferrum sp.]